MKYKLLRLSLLSVLVMLFGGGIFAITNALMDAQQAEPEVTLDFTVKANWPTVPTSGSANKDLTSFTNSDESYTIKLYATNNYKMNDGYLILGKKDSYLELPAFDFDVEKIEVVGNGDASKDVKQNIYVGNNAVSTETTGAKVTNTYEIESGYQAAGNIYKLVVTSAHNTQITYIKVYKKSESTDTRTETTVTFADGYATSGAVGDVLDLPAVTISAGGTPIDAVPTWESDNEGVANIANGKLNLMTKGTAKITASFAGDNDLKPSSKSYTVTVCDKYTAIAAILENITSTKTDMVFEFTDLLVTYVNGKNTYVSDGTNAIQFYGAESGLKAGDKITGSISGKAYAYNNLPEITDFKLTVTAKTEGNEVTFTPIAPDALGDNINKPIIIDNAVYVSVDDNNNYTFKVGETSFVVRNTWSVDVSSLTADKAYKLTGMGSVFKTTNQLNLISFEDATTDEPAGFRDIKLDLTAHSEVLTEAPVYITVAEDGSIGTTDNVENAAATIKGKVHSSYGSSNFTASVPVQGCVKITYATHDFGNDISVTNSEGVEVAQFNTLGGKWMSDHSNVVVAYYRTNTPTTLNFSNASYNPYFAVEAIDEADLPPVVETATVTFALGNQAAEGVVPNPITVVKGETVHFPANYTLYVEGKTMKYWMDADGNALQDGALNADMTVYPYFEDNTANLADRTEPVTISFNLSGYNDYPKYKFEGNNGIMVTQATVNEKTIDVKVDVDATGGKFAHNGSGWHQVNQGAKVTVPSCKGATIAVSTYNDETGASMTFAGNAGTADNKVVSYTATATDATCEIAQMANNYWNKLEVTLPVVEQGGDEPVDGAPVTATWDFQNKIPASIVDVNIQGADATGTVDSDVEGIKLNVLAAVAGTNIKLQYNSQGYAQFNQNTCIQVPVVSTSDVVTVVSYPGQSKYTVGGEDATGQNEFSHTATAAEVKKGFVEIIASGTAYIYSIKVVQNPSLPPVGPVLVEKSIYKTDFSEWTTFSASTTDPVVVNKTTKYTNENLDFSVFNTALMTTEDSKFANYTTLPHNTLRAEKAADPYVTTTALGNITKVRFVHGATGGSRGWKLEAKGDGDADWVVISDSYANPSSWCEVTKDINKTNCQLRFTNLTSNQNAYLFELEIFGKVDLSGAPLLESLTYNNKTYNADDIFEMGNSGDYEARIELFRSDIMPSAENPVTAVAANGEIGEITYQGAGYGTMVTIPVTAEGKTVKYVANFQLKPMLTLSYIGVDGETVLGTQQVEKDAEIGEFAVDIANVSSLRNGYKARGWFKQNYVGEKYTTASTFAEDSKLYAVETEIEVASTSRKYEFNLADKFFYAEDHEAFTPQEGAQCKFHDTTHGWSVYNGDKIDLLVGPKAIISIATCRYGHLDKILVKKGEETLAELQGMDADTDGKVVSYTYEGEEGTLTLEMTTSGESYIHSVKIANVAETNYEQDGQWLFVKAGDVSSFIDALEVANGTAGDDRVFIFLPNGTYDLGTAVQTPISRNNVSLIGESMEGTIIKNAPPTSKEGLMSASTIHNTGNNLYMQDLTLQNDLDYYSAGSAGRANAFHDGGDKTIAKNVKLMSYQDTYLTPANKQTYWETSEIHGAVDFICGGGDIFFEKCDLVTESRKKGEKSGEATIVAPQPQTAEKFGYVFNNCTIENQAATFNFGRAWGGASGATVGPMAAYLNTTLNQPNEIRATRFITAGMNEAADKFKEYNSMDKDGNVVSPASNVLKFTHSTGDKEYETILTADEAAGYALDKVFPDWTPANYTVQVEAPAAELKDGTISWTPANNGAIAYAIFKNGALLGITTETSFVVEPVAETGEAAPRRAEAADKYTIRAANARGGFGEAKEVKDAATGISTVKNGQQTDTIYNMQGVRVNNAQKGVYIINGKKVVIK